MPLPKRLDALTGLRFVAAMMIVLYHFDDLGLPKAFNWPLAVGFFFVLSGFIMMYVHPHIVGAAQASRFFWDRFTRIWPAHALVLAAYVMLLGYPVTRYFWTNLFLVHSLWPVENSFWSYNYPSWSLSVEMAFYASFPFIAYRWETTWWWKIALALAMPLGMLAAAAHVGAYDGDRPGIVNDVGLLGISPASRMAEFVLGMACCSVFKAVYPRSRPSLPLYTMLEVLAVISFAFVFSGIPEAFTAGRVGHAVQTALVGFGLGLTPCMAIVLAFAFGRGLVSKLFASRTCVYLGDISFSIYVTHAFVYDSYKSLHRADDGVRNGLACVAVTLALSALLHHLFERPVRQRLRSLPERIAAWWRRSGPIGVSPEEEASPSAGHPEPA